MPLPPRPRLRAIRPALTLLVAAGVAVAALAGPPEPVVARSVSAYPVVVDPVPDLRHLPPAGPGAGPEARASGVDVFTLHSRPGSRFTIFLDFDGADLSSTAYSSLTGAPKPAVVPAVDLDGKAGRSTWERGVIELIWQQVAEDFAPFDVDVTTQQPPVGALSRTGAADTTYGTTVLFSHDNWIRTWCQQCAGIGYAGVFGGVANDPWRTAVVFPDFLTRRTTPLDAATIARIAGTTASHEVGHHLGLSHDGLQASSPLGAQGYHPGQGIWGPIMGATAHALTRWAGPEVPHTNNREDDLAIIGSQLGLVPDELPAVPLVVGRSVTGVISSTFDTDVYLVTPLRSATVTVSPVGASANLDLALSVQGGSSRAVVVDPPARVVGGVLEGLGASASLTGGVVYRLTVSSARTPSVGGYGSLGRYSVVVR